MFQKWLLGYNLVFAIIPRPADYRYRDVEEIMCERGLSVGHSTVFRWVQRYAPEINRRMRPHLRMSGTSYRIDETYVQVRTEWKYLYRAVDSVGDTIEFMLSARPGVSAAKLDHGKWVGETRATRGHHDPAGPEISGRRRSQDR